MNFRPGKVGHKIKMGEFEIAARAAGAFQLLTGRWYRSGVDMQNNTAASFMEYLESNGIKHFLGDFEPLRPHQPSKLPTGTLLLPPPIAWPIGLLLAAIGDMLREKHGPIHWRNWWRPLDYNKHVGGAKPKPPKLGSDHIYACAADFDFLPGRPLHIRKRAAMAARKGILRDLHKSRIIPTSIGWGSYFHHVGVFAPETLRLGNPCRTWRY